MSRLPMVVAATLLAASVLAGCSTTRVYYVEASYATTPGYAAKADPKTPGTECRDNKTGRRARWQKIDGEMWC